MSIFDNLDRLTGREVSVNGGNTLKAAWGFDGKGDRTSMTKSAWVNGAWSSVGESTFTFDDLGRETGIVHQNASKTVTFGNYQYLFDAANRVTQQTIDGVTTKYEYDNTNQLTKDGGTGFTYDANGNRTMAGYSTSKGNRTTGDGTWTYGYDDEGNVTSKTSTAGTWAYEFDFRNQMTKASFTPAGGGSITKSVEYKFDAFGNRLERAATENGTTTVERYAYDGWDTAHPQAIGSENFNAVLDLDVNNAVTVRRTFGAGFDELVAREDASGGNTKWYGTDKLGSVRFVSDDNGTKSNSTTYNGWGDILSGTMVDRYGFQGREHDAVTGLRHHRARETNGQFWLSEDPIGFMGNDFNLRRVSGNNRASFSDPSGLDYITVENDTVYFTRTYSWLVPGRDVKLYVGKLVEIDGVKYVKHGKYLVPLSRVTSVIETYFSSGEGGDWKDPNKMTAWFAAEDVSSEILKPHDQRKAADRMYGPMIITGQQAADLVRDMITDVTIEVLVNIAGSFGAAKFFDFAAYVVNRGFKFVRDGKGQITHIIDKTGRVLNKDEYNALADKFKQETANPNRYTGAMAGNVVKAKGKGLGILAGKSLRATEANLKIIEEHLQKHVNSVHNGGKAFMENEKMLARIRQAIKDGKEISGADLAWYAHELYEYRLTLEYIANGHAVDVAQKMAHDATFAKFGNSEFSVYHPDVIREVNEARPGDFNDGWLKFWETLCDKC